MTFISQAPRLRSREVGRHARAVAEVLRYTSVRQRQQARALPLERDERTGGNGQLTIYNGQWTIDNLQFTMND